MEDLIKALNIFLKYGNPEKPTHCQDETMFVYINPILVSEEDFMTLEELSFGADGDGFVSYRFGGC